jgi:formylglycine-generating enzyme required for sulfatase activity
LSSEYDSSSILFDIVDMFERDRRSGSLLGLAHYLARFPGHEEEVAREYLRLLDPPLPCLATPPSPPSSAAGTGLAHQEHDAATDFLKSSGTPFSELLRRLAAPILRGTHFWREEEIARGGMGVIHRVRDIELDRTLALKEMILGPADEHALASARFLEEAQVTAQLDHPGIVPIHEVGLNAERHLYFAMKLVRGRDLRGILDLAREGREGWTQPRMLGVLLKVCEAMAYAHSKGVIHRDLKPGNVMVGHFGEVYVMDWGLARVMGRQDVHDIRLKLGDPTESLRTARREEREETPDSPLVTMDGNVVGTPAYMSPEQARGEIHLLSPRSDVYSIGAMLYHLLTGQTPYVPSGARLSKHTVLARVIEGPPRPMQELASDLPVELVAICEKAMARDPGQRYQDTLALAEDLRCYLEGRVVKAHETGAIAELKKWVRRNKGMAVTSAAAIAALICGLATSSSLYVRAADNAEHADRNAALAKSEQERANLLAAAATRRAEEVLRLSALQDLEDLITLADRLWPAYPEQMGEYQGWLRDAQRLVSELDKHKAALAEFRSTASLGAEEKPATQPTEHAKLREQPGHQQLIFADSQDKWWFNQLEKLVRGLETLSSENTGLLSAGTSPGHGWGIMRRLEFARTIQDLSISGAEASQRWAEATASVRDRIECPWYGGLELSPQLGLLPIGQDPDSDLWEFAHLQTGEPATRDPGGKIILNDQTGLVLVLIPAGTFLMGAQKVDQAQPNYDRQAHHSENPVHEVNSSAFFLSKYEMTQSQWERATGQRPSFFGPEKLLPVEQVSWNSCNELCNRLGLALPTEAQWEYAARGRTSTPWWVGEDASLLANVANLKNLGDQDDGVLRTGRVGQFDPNPFGLYDVYGNVGEWCLDGNTRYAPNPQNDPREEPPGDAHRMARGGAYNSRPALARSSFRDHAAESFAQNTLGLRPSMAISP